ncbi:FAD-binding protein [Xenorhabdus sp. 12]|uniref:FAD-binding protein n=2 Tax=Xenorhabdus santafensis TaxID=2582833 RepID=A0ABU4SAR8_9GAMM|nr:FAD-binding protein [Xenorhabdus sp. 12]
MSSSDLIKQSYSQLSFNQSQENIIVDLDCHLPNFPNEIECKKIIFKNWSGEINIPNMPCCMPRTSAEVIAVVNWAWKENYKVRPIGQAHNWSPLVLASGQNTSNRILLMDLSKHFTNVHFEHQSEFSIVTAQTAILMETLMTRMEEQGLGFAATPAPGDLTLGGVLAIGGHGTAIKTHNEIPQPGHVYGSLSNTILSLSAVVWDAKSQQYVVKRFERNNPDCAPLLTHIGSSLILEVQFQAGKNQRLRCQSFTQISMDELFAAPEETQYQHTITQFLDKSGRIEVILFPFTNKPWLKVWSVAPTRPPSSVEVKTPYNYPFSDNVPLVVSDISSMIFTIAPEVTPLMGEMKYQLVNAALQGYTKDIWGWSKNVLLYVKPTTLRVTANGYAVLTRRADIQHVLHVFYEQWKKLLVTYATAGKYPINGPIEVRVTGLDTPSEVMVENAVTSSLSAIRPRPDKTEWDVAIWLDILTFPGTPHAIEFLNQFEKWLFKEFNGTYASARVEWSKGWAYGKTSAWEDKEVLTKTIPTSFTEGLPTDNNWVSAVSALQQHDPHHIFRSPLLDKLFTAGN